MRSDKKDGIFYGWWIISACFVIALYTAGVIGYSFTAFFEPIAKEFGWSYASISIASSLRSFEVGLLSPLVGYLTDRYGPRLVILGGGIIIGAGLILFSRISSLPMFYFSMALIAVGLSGPSVTPMVATVANWFRKRSGFTIGIVVAGYGFAGFLVPVVVWLIDTFTWRVALNVLGIGTFLIVVPLSFLVRRRPEDYGLLPDGEKTVDIPSGEQKTVKKSADVSISTRQALRSRTFWHIGITFALQHLVANSITTHVMPYLSSVGVSRGVAGLAATGIPVTSIIGRFAFGWLADRLKQRWIAAWGLVLMAVGVFLFILASRVPSLLFISITIFGIGFGGTNTMRPVMTRDYFGIGSFATILGLVTGVGTIGGVVGAPVAGRVYDAVQSYLPIWYVYLGIAILAAVIIATTPAVKVGSPSSKDSAGVAGNKR